MAKLPGDRKHENFAKRWGHLGNGRLEWGLDFIKAMPKEWTDEKRWATMVELYDEVRYERDEVVAKFDNLMDTEKWRKWVEHLGERQMGRVAMIEVLISTPEGINLIKEAMLSIELAEHLSGE